MIAFLLFIPEPQQVLAWTCVLIFIFTGIITLLGIVKKINIEPSYLNRLFVALILEVISIGVLSFKDSFKPAPVNEFIKIVSPTSGFNVGSNPSISVYGAYNKTDKEQIIGKLLSSGKSIILSNNSSDNNIFFTNIDSSLLSDNAQITFSIVKDKEEIKRDQIILKK